MSEILSLVRRLEVYREAYTAGAPLVSDALYDNLEDELRILDPSNEFFKGVNGEKTSQFVQATTGEPMLSLDKIKEPSDLVKFIDGKPTIARSKVDGGSLELRYRKGFLLEAVSRGRDGELGFICTNNALALHNVPHTLNHKDGTPFTGEIRGEAIMFWLDFEAYLTTLPEDERGEAKHPRNITTGTMRQLDHRIVRERKIRFIAYKIMNQIDRFPTEQAVDEFLQDSGFIIPKSTPFLDPTVLKDPTIHLERLQKSLELEPFPCDGIVFTYNDRTLQEKLGNSTTAPRWACAFKWQNEVIETTVLSVEWTTNRSGKISPVAICIPIQIGGCTTSRCTLHNVGYVREHQVRIGAKIAMIRSGEIIPTHLETVDAGSGEFSIPTHCPTCNTATVEITTGKDSNKKTSLHCPNVSCPAQLFKKVLNYVNVAKIDHIGEGILETLWDQNIVRSITDLYLIPGRNIGTIVTAKGKTLGASTAKKISQSIERASVLDPAQFLQALGIHDLGAGTSERLIEKFKTVPAVVAATKVELAGCRDFGAITVENVFNGLQSHKELIENLMKLVKFKDKPDQIVLYNILNGAKFVITGTLTNVREEVETMIKGAGGEIQSSVSRSTNYLLVGAEPGESKMGKARALGTKIITEDDFLELLARMSGAENRAAVKELDEIVLNDLDALSKEE